MWDLKSNHITQPVLSYSENRRSFAHPSIIRIIAWNGHTMGLFMDESIETSHGKIRHMERTDKRVFAGKENPYFGRQICQKQANKPKMAYSRDALLENSKRQD